MKRTTYNISLIFSGAKINEIIIDQHYKINHPEMNDLLIIKLVLQLNNLVFLPTEFNDEFFYFKEEPIFLENKPYRLVLVVEKNKNYLGVINAFRIQEKKYGIPV